MLAALRSDKMLVDSVHHRYSTLAYVLFRVRMIKTAANLDL